MGFLITILVFLVLLVGFLLLTVFERRRGRRFLARQRAALDIEASALAGSVRNVDAFGLMLRGLRTLVNHIAHDIANVALAAVRLLERSLTSAVHSLRGAREGRRTETSSRFVKSMSYFKRTLRAPEPKAPEVETPEDTVG